MKNFTFIIASVILMALLAGCQKESPGDNAASQLTYEERIMRSENPEECGSLALTEAEELCRKIAEEDRTEYCQVENDIASKSTEKSFSLPAADSLRAQTEFFNKKKAFEDRFKTPVMGTLTETELREADYPTLLWTVAVVSPEMYYKILKYEKKFTDNDRDLEQFKKAFRRKALKKVKSTGLTFLHSTTFFDFYTCQADKPCAETVSEKQL